MSSVVCLPRRACREIDILLTHCLKKNEPTNRLVEYYKTFTELKKKKKKKKRVDLAKQFCLFCLVRVTYWLTIDRQTEENKRKEKPTHFISIDVGHFDVPISCVEAL